MGYTNIAIIYNPTSTGSSELLARELEAQLRKRKPAQDVTLIATEYAGHAEELTYSIAHETKRPLIISSSGDGGYHEVVNGAIRAQLEGATPTTGLLPAGNANDHHRNLHKNDLLEQILHEKKTTIDILKLTAHSKGKVIERYTHSYIGIGITPIVAAELNKNRLNLLTEAWIVISSLLRRRSVRLVINDSTKHYESIIFSNVATMSKYLRVSQSSDIADGKFEVTIMERRGWWQFIATLLKASSTGIREDGKESSFSLTTVRRTLLQADGEVIAIDANSDIHISIEKHALTSVV